MLDQIFTQSIFFFTAIQQAKGQSASYCDHYLVHADVYVASGLTSGATHQIPMQVTGTRNVLSTGNRVDADGFVTLP